MSFVLDSQKTILLLFSTGHFICIIVRRVLSTYFLLHLRSTTRLYLSQSLNPTLLFFLSSSAIGLWKVLFLSLDSEASKVVFKNFRSVQICLLALLHIRQTMEYLVFTIENRNDRGLVVLVINHHEILSSTAFSMWNFLKAVIHCMSVRHISDKNRCWFPKPFRNGTSSSKCFISTAIQWRIGGISLV